MSCPPSPVSDYKPGGRVSWSSPPNQYYLSKPVYCAALPPAPKAQKQSTTNDKGGQQDSQKAIDQDEPRPRINHGLHFVLTILFRKWLIVWIILCIIYE